MTAPAKTKAMLDPLIQKFNSLKKREKTLVILLAITVAASGFFNIVYKPHRIALNKMKKELALLKDRATEVKAKIPDIAGEQRFLEEERRLAQVLKEELGSLESKLPQQNRLPQLLGELVTQASGYSIDFISIKPIPVEKKKVYASVTIEMKFASGYSDLINYLNRLERISQYLSIATVTMEREKEDANSRSQVTLTLSTILGEGAGTQETRPKEASLVQPIAIQRDPFVSRSEAQPQDEKKQEHHVTGIISRKERSTAIVDGDAYRIGDVVGDKKIKEILPDMVVLSNGVEDTILTMEKEEISKTRITQ